MSFSSKSFVSASLGWYNINVSSKAEKTFFGMKPGRPATQIIKNGKQLEKQPTIYQSCCSVWRSALWLFSGNYGLFR